MYPALLTVLARAKLKLGPDDGLLSVNTTSYVPPTPRPTNPSSRVADAGCGCQPARQRTLSNIYERLDRVPLPKL
jgi:hypothetical protein